MYLTLLVFFSPAILINSQVEKIIHTKYLEFLIKIPELLPIQDENRGTVAEIQ